ncbi:unnamed protein product [Boreogadus saida]
MLNTGTGKQAPIPLFSDTQAKSISSTLLNIYMHHQSDRDTCSAHLLSLVGIHNRHGWFPPEKLTGMPSTSNHSLKYYDLSIHD